MSKDSYIERMRSTPTDDKFLILGLRGMVVLFGGAKNLANVLYCIADIFDTGVKLDANFHKIFMELYESVCDFVFVNTDVSRVTIESPFTTIDNLEQCLKNPDKTPKKIFKHIHNFLEILNIFGINGNTSIIPIENNITFHLLNNVKKLLNYLLHIVDFRDIISETIILKGRRNTYFVNTKTGIIARRDIPGASIVYL